jgi:hypothetical protein
VATNALIGGYRPAVPYPPRKEHRSVAGFAGTASLRADPAVHAQVERFIVEQYAAGRSLRELAELTDRSFGAVRNILDRRGVRRRGVGAARLTGETPTERNR